MALASTSSISKEIFVELNTVSLLFILDNIQVAICILDYSTNKIVYTNKHFCELVEFSKEELLNFEDPFELFSKNSLEYVKEYIRLKLEDVDDEDMNKKYVRLRRIKRERVVNTRFRILKFEQDSKTYLCISAINLTNLLREKKELKQKAQTDFLTGIYNRLSIETKLNEFDGSYGVIIFDIDDFKYVNDTYGHNTGDEILKKVTQEVKSCLRSKDIFIRWGGDEFIIVITDILPKDLIKIARKIKDKVSSIDFGINKNITISMGAGIFDAQNTLESVINAIDKALYKAKHTGKNKIKWHI